MGIAFPVIFDLFKSQNGVTGHPRRGHFMPIFRFLCPSLIDVGYVWDGQTDGRTTAISAK